jgi:hypothetical protein
LLAVSGVRKTQKRPRTISSHSTIANTIEAPDALIPS